MSAMGSGLVCLSFSGQGQPPAHLPQCADAERSRVQPDPWQPLQAVTSCPRLSGTSVVSPIRQRYRTGAEHPRSRARLLRVQSRWLASAAAVSPAAGPGRFAGLPRTKGIALDRRRLDGPVTKPGIAVHSLQHDRIAKREQARIAERRLGRFSMAARDPHR